jgi:hypothetical protein
LIGSLEASRILGITKPSLTRRVTSGSLHPLAKLDGERGAYVFDRNDIQALTS